MVFSAKGRVVEGPPPWHSIPDWPGRNEWHRSRSPAQVQEFRFSLKVDFPGNLWRDGHGHVEHAHEKTLPAVIVVNHYPGNGISRLTTSSSRDHGSTR
jgi:hypothetical protein